MKSILIILISNLLLLATLSTAQEPQWELITDEYWINALAIDPTDSQVIYIEDYKGFYKTINGGVTWDTIGNGLNNRPSKIIVDHNNPDVLWAGGRTPRTSAIPEWMAISKSTDGGLNWFKSDTGLADFFHGDQILDMEIDRARNILYAYDNIVPIYKSTNGGTYWENISTLEVPAGSDLAIDEDDGTLYFATDGIWKKELNDEEWIPIREGLPQNQFGYVSVSQIATVKGANTLYSAVNIKGPGYQIYKSCDNGNMYLSPNVKRI
jgi:hypothetical protein